MKFRESFSPSEKEFIRRNFSIKDQRAINHIVDIHQLPLREFQ